MNESKPFFPLSESCDNAARTHPCARYCHFVLPSACARDATSVQPRRIAVVSLSPSKSAVSGLFLPSLERQREEPSRNGKRDRTGSVGGWQGVSESAVSAKRGWGWFGAKAAPSETPERAAAKRRPPVGGHSGTDAKPLS